MITFEDFSKIDLKIAKILKAERVENSEKLIKLKIKVGGKEKQIVAGIGKFYNPEDLREKLIVIVDNLEPKKIMGLQSEGMLLAASNGEEFSLIVPDKEIKDGSQIK
ncbi:MAG: methionine--tRNA ligase subunit beta [Minisyncoccia bacterium]